jgi:hypothetical protein
MLRTRVITALFLVAGLALILFALPPLAARWPLPGSPALAAWEWGGLMKLDRRRGTCMPLHASGLLAAYRPRRNWCRCCSGLSAAFWLLVVPFGSATKWSLSGNDMPSAT